MRAPDVAPAPPEYRALERSTPDLYRSSSTVRSHSAWHRLETPTTAHNLRLQQGDDGHIDRLLADHLGEYRRFATEDRLSEGRWWDLSISPGSVGVLNRPMPSTQPPMPTNSRSRWLLHEDGQVEKLEAPVEGAVVFDDRSGRWCVRPFDLLLGQGKLSEVEYLEWGTRGVIRGFSRKSRLRMLRALSDVDWLAEPGHPDMVTLTYPRQYPRDGRICQAHLRAFTERHRRKWGDARFAWKREYQRRGAPHFHLYIFRPSGVGIDAYRAWVARAWFEVVGSGDARHLRAGTAVDQQFCSKVRSSRMIAWYFAKHNIKGDHSKAYQNDAPDDAHHIGRYWGIVGIERKVSTFPISHDLAVEVMRTLRRYRRAQTAGGRKINVGARRHAWALVHVPALLVGQVLATRMAEWVNVDTGEVLDPGCWPPGLPRPLP